MLLVCVHKASMSNFCFELEYITNGSHTGTSCQVEIPHVYDRATQSRQRQILKMVNLQVMASTTRCIRSNLFKTRMTLKILINRNTFTFKPLPSTFVLVLSVCTKSDCQCIFVCVSTSKRIQACEDEPSKKIEKIDQ